MTAKLRHIAISVPELRPAAEFYKKTFGLEEVNYVETPYGDAQALAASQTLSLKDGDGERRIELASVSPDIAASLRGVGLVFMPDPAFTQLDNARRVAPHLADGQVVFFAPGTFGSYIVAQCVRQSGRRADVAYAETGTLPWLARKHGPTTAAITARATRLPTGVYPARHADRALGVIRRAFAG